MMDMKMRSLVGTVFSLLILFPILFSCGTKQGSQPMGGDSLTAYTALFFDVNNTSIKGGSADSIERLQRKIKNVNLSGSESFWPGKKLFFMHAMGAINFPDAKQYTFRLTCNGKIVFRLNNIDLFGQWDVKDTVLLNTHYVTKGSNMFEFEYFDGGVEPKIILEWSTDGQTFEVVPDKAFAALNRVAPPVVVSRQDSAATTQNVLTTKEKAEGWKLLFDGNSTKGWHRYNYPGVIGKKWMAKNGTLVFEGRNRFRYELENCVIEIGDVDKTADGGWDIATDESFGDFELKLEWKISKGGNSGIFYTVLEDPKYDEAWKTSPEMQVLDNYYNKEGFIAKHMAGDLYDLISCDEITALPNGSWNNVRIIKQKNHVEHWLNGKKVVEYSMNSPEWKVMISKSKFATLRDYGTAKPSKIALQDHDNAVAFRNIKIKELK
jgi:hypothetical protein